MRNFIPFVFVCFLCIPAFGTGLIIKLEKGNASAMLHDGYASLEVSGGQPPYTYKWSDKATPLSSSSAGGLAEGSVYSVVVSDSQGRAAAREFRIPATYPGEKINHFFDYMVKAFSSVLMVDIFAMLELYDPVLYSPTGEMLLYPNGDPQKMSIPFIVVWLIVGAIFFTFKLNFASIRCFRHAISLVRGRYDRPEDKGDISHFQALTTALSATVGLGNIAGVAIAISIGGPGAVFWMVLAGFFGMSSKMAESMLGVQFRRHGADGTVSGGPMYYLRYAFGATAVGRRTGKFVAAMFAVLLIGGSFGGGNMFQANQAFSQLSMMLPFFEDKGVYFGLLLAFLVGAVIIGGIKSIAGVTSKIVPFMAVLYVTTSLVIIFMNIGQAGQVAREVIEGAFSAPAAKGGFVGVLIMGIRRAAFSNEAGIGSAAIAHSAAKTKEPASEGIVALLEPFIDTVVICSLTAMVLMFTGFHNPEAAAGLQGAQLTSSAFGSVFWLFPWFLLVAIFLFSFSTMVAWSYYGIKGFDYLFGAASEKYFGNRKVSDTAYRLLFLLFIVVGAASSLSSVIDFSDMMILGMALPNIFGLYIYAPRIKRGLDKYWAKVKSGEIAPVK
jgi:amino acid carrier protein